MKSFKTRCVEQKVPIKAEHPKSRGYSIFVIELHWLESVFKICRSPFWKQPKVLCSLGTISPLLVSNIESASVLSQLEPSKWKKQRIFYLNIPSTKILYSWHLTYFNCRHINWLHKSYTLIRSSLSRRARQPWLEKLLNSSFSISLR